MPDEIGTETSRSDALSADESLFGDAADDAAAAVVDEQDAGKETEQDPEGSDDDETQAGPPEDLKVVVSIKGGRATIGVQQPSSDPHIESFDDRDLSGLTQEVLPVIERARAKWEDEPRHPAHERPAPPARRRPRREQGSAQSPTAERETDQQATRDAEAVLKAGPRVGWALDNEREREEEPVGAGRQAARYRGRSSQRRRLPPASPCIGLFCV